MYHFLILDVINTMLNINSPKTPNYQYSVNCSSHLNLILLNSCWFSYWLFIRSVKGALLSIFIWEYFGNSVYFWTSKLTVTGERFRRLRNIEEREWLVRLAADIGDTNILHFIQHYHTHSNRIIPVITGLTSTHWTVAIGYNIVC